MGMGRIVLSSTNVMGVIALNMIFSIAYYFGVTHSFIFLQSM